MEDFFKKKFASEVEATFKILDHLMQQIDPATGKRYDGIGGAQWPPGEAKT